jgi:putative spermidine/putrescine transport system substrate-binding protein
MIPRLRRRALVGAAGLLAAGAAGAQPVAEPPLRLLDLLGGDVGEALLRDFAAAHPALPPGLLEEGEPADVTEDLREAVEAGRSGIDVVLAPQVGVLAGLDAGLWLDLGDWGLAPLLPDAAMEAWRFGGGTALPLLVVPGGPLLAWRAGTATRGPRDPAELLDWARQNPGRFLYPRPPLSTAGRVFLGTLPWLLGDRDPADPLQGWDRSWDWLAELGRHVAYYPAGTAAAVEEFRDDGCDMLVLTPGEDAALRAQGSLPADLGAAPFEGQPWAVLALMLCVPRDLPAARRPLVAALLRHALDPAVRARLPFAPPASEDRAARGTARLPLRIPADPPLAPMRGPAALRAMLARWDREIGASFGRP